jgi:nucleotide-binding universal stress UspA family protein
MTCKLVVPLDGSKVAEQGLGHAVKLVRQSGGYLVLIRVVPADDMAITTHGDESEHDHWAATRAAERYLATVAQRLGSDVHVCTRVVHGCAANEIVSTANRVGADAIVMATHGQTGLTHLLYGSVAEAVVATSRVPVILVPARLDAATRASVERAYMPVQVPTAASAFGASRVSGVFRGTRVRPARVPEAAA